MACESDEVNSFAVGYLSFGTHFEFIRLAESKIYFLMVVSNTRSPRGGRLRCEGWLSQIRGVPEAGDSAAKGTNNLKEDLNNFVVLSGRFHWSYQ
jgi:hypothetical protein